MVDRDPEEIKAEIDRTREQLAVTVDTLTERAHPRRLANDLKVAVITFVKKPPVTFALIGAGALTVVVVIYRIRNR
ncbi:MAG: DUF3618 domain-containing protein [Candidatus Sericytochromatia bacterium]